MWKKSVALQERVAVQASQEQKWLSTASFWDRNAASHQELARRSLNGTDMLLYLRQAESDRSFVEYCQRRADYSARLRLKYEQAASRPWLAVAPDPPVPK